MTLKQCSTEFSGHRDMGAEKRKSGLYRSFSQILGNIKGDVGVFNIGDPTINTTKFILEYIKIESWSISHESL